MKKFISILFFCINSFILYANNQTNLPNISGHVIDAKTKEHLPFVTISIKGTSISASTDETGHFYIKNIPIGKHTINLSYEGYNSIDTVVNILSNKTFEFKLSSIEEPITLNGVTVSATKNETNNKKTANIVKVISAKQFETNAASSMCETMNFNSGLRAENSCSNCGAIELKINGLEGKYSQILLDNRPLFSSLASVYSLEQIPISMIERIEIVKGGGSAIFGASAIGGAVNIVTKDPLNNSISVNNTTNLTSNGKSDINTNINGSFVSKNGKGGIYLFGMIKSKDAYDRNKDGFSDIPHLKSSIIGFRGYYKTSSFSRLTLEYHHINEFRRGGDSVNLPPHQTNIAEQLQHYINGGGIRFDTYSSDNKHKFQLYSSGQKVQRNSYFGTDKNLDAYGYTQDFTVISGFQYTFSPDKFLFSKANITFGGEYTHNTLKDKILGYNKNLNQFTNVISSFLQSEWNTNLFNINIGTRADKHNLINKPIISPRANIKFSPKDWISIRAGYSRGYLAPQAYNEDLHVSAVGGEVSLIKISPNLKPEYSNSLNLSVDLYWNFRKLQTNLLIEGFYTFINNIFTLRKQGEDSSGNIILIRENYYGAKVRGINIEAKLGIPNIFDIQFGYTFQKNTYDKPFKWSENVPAQQKMFRSPNSYGYVTANYKISPNLTLSLFGNYTGTMLVQHNAGFVKKDEEKWTPNFIDLGTKLSYNLKMYDDIQLNIYGGVKNILDQFQNDIDLGKLKDANYIYGPADPRKFFIGIKVLLL